MAVFSLARPPIMQNFISCCHWTAVPAWCSVCPPSDLPPVFNPFNTFKFRLSEFARPLNIGSGNEIGLRITDGERCLIECRKKNMLEKGLLFNCASPIVSFYVGLSDGSKMRERAIKKRNPLQKITNFFICTLLYCAIVGNNVIRRLQCAYGKCDVRSKEVIMSACCLPH